MKICGSICVLALFFSGAFCAQLRPLEYLYDYGYLAVNPRDHGAANSPNGEMKNAILKFQSFNGLPQTGIIDKITENKMRAPRCGVQDLFPNEYRTTTCRKMHDLTWKISKYSQTSKLSPNQQRLIMRRAVKRWTDVTPLSIQEAKYNTTLDVRFEIKNHVNHKPFDGKDGVLGHAAFPPGNYIHFDDEEDWINGTVGGYDLETVSAHEFGHALGLDHSDMPESLMAPFYQTFPDDFTLYWDDVVGIQRLYGKNPKNSCNLSYRSIDAAMRINENDFVFVDNGDVIDGRNGKKMAVQSLFPGGPDWVQAAVYSRVYGRAYLFKNNKVWAYTVSANGKFNLVKNFPKYISNNQINAPECAIKYNDRNERIFLYKKGYFYTFYQEDVYPKDGNLVTKYFRGVPSKVDAAISANYEINFIVKKTAYSMFTNSRVVSDKGKPVDLVLKMCPKRV